MTKTIFFFFLMIWASDCNDSPKSSGNTDILIGRYTHTIQDCDNSFSPEMNCTQFVDFIDKKQVDVLIGGGDIVHRTTYRIDGKNIKIDPSDQLGFDLTFSILEDESLERIEDGTVWRKKE